MRRTEKREDHRDAEAVDWDAGAGGLAEEAGGVAVERKRVEGSGGAVDVRGADPIISASSRSYDKPIHRDPPAEKILVTINAFVKSGSTLIPMFFIAITYGLLAPVPVSPASRSPVSVGSLEGRMMPTQRAPMMKKMPKRQ